MLFLKYQEMSADSPEDKNPIIEWFENFTNALREIYDCPELILKHEAKELTFKIIIPGRLPFGLNEMSDGYSAFLNVFIELLLRSNVGENTVPSVVLIDEIEEHLHVELQKRALPFLTKMFPHTQFIVATHSPFVITSLENAVVFDLEKKEALDNPSLYSYESVVESFLDTSAYSQRLSQHFARYKELCFKDDRSPEENEEFLRAKVELELMSPASKELYLAFNALEEKRKAAKI
jgi:AAA15 family ATPase/GTPase